MLQTLNAYFDSTTIPLLGGLGYQLIPDVGRRGRKGPYTNFLDTTYGCQFAKEIMRHHTGKAYAAQVKTREISRGSNNPQIYIRRVRK